MRRRKDPDKEGGFVEYSKPVCLPWKESDPHVEVQCEWYRKQVRTTRFVLGNVHASDNDWVHVASVCAPVVITYCSGTHNPRLYELDEASQSLVTAVANGDEAW